MQPIKSPYQSPKNPIADKNKMAEIAQFLGVRGLMLIGSHEDATKCNHKTCTGHEVFVNQTGFTDEQIAGFARMLCEQAGMTVTDPDEDEY